MGEDIGDGWIERGSPVERNASLLLVERRACPRSTLQQSAFFSLELSQDGGGADIERDGRKFYKKRKKKKRNEGEEDNLFSSRFKPTMKSEPKNV